VCDKITFVLSRLNPFYTSKFFFVICFCAVPARRILKSKMFVVST
jgi:hypothetical protein